MFPVSPVPLHTLPPSKKCLCQLCSCGCHHCLHLPNWPYERNEKPCMVSEYMERYPLYPVTAPRDPFKPERAHMTMQLPMEGISTTKRDYIPHEVLPQKPKPPAQHVKTDECMDLTSTYQQDYSCYPVSQVLPPCLPCGRRHIPNTKMDTRTTYEGDYVLWNGLKAEPIRPNDEFQPPEEKTNHRTVVQDDYLYRGPVVTQSCKPLTLVQKTKDPFENITNYRVNYVPHPLEKHYVHENESYKVNKVPLDGLTTHKVSYKGLAGQPAKSAKPEQQKVLHDLPLSSRTEFQEKYQAWPQPPMFTKKPDIYLPPLEKMDFHTTTQTHYKHSNGKPAKTCKPSAQATKSTKPFSNSSVMREDYKPLLGMRPNPIIHAPELTCPTQPMDCATTFQTHYVPHSLTVTKSCKPGCSDTKHHTPLDAKTVYATTYTPKGIVRCLATYKDPPGYTFKGISADGHKLYLCASKNVCKMSTEEKGVDTAFLKKDSKSRASVRYK